MLISKDHCMLANICLRIWRGSFLFLLISTAIAMAIGIRVLLFERYSSPKGFMRVSLHMYVLVPVYLPTRKAIRTRRLAGT